jgi:hypothetical protein
VTAQVADKLLDESLEKGANFQHRAYARMARGSRREGFTHAAFLDVDEYWAPRDLRSQVHTFLPDEADVNVVSFQWGVDIPDVERRPFTPLFEGPERFQLMPHVKSIVRLDDSILKMRTHTAQTTTGVRLLVREPLPMTDERAQQWGSLVPPDYWTSHWHSLPEAFVVHALHRSATEYVARLADGDRQTGTDRSYKTNRHGYVAGPAPLLSFDPDGAAVQAYHAARERFHGELGVEQRIRHAESLHLPKARLVMAEVAKDGELMGQLRVALRGVPAPELDELYPGWDATVEWWVDGTQQRLGRTWVVGWGYTVPATPLEFALRDKNGQLWTALDATVTARPEVRSERGDAPVECGFEFAIPWSLEGLHQDAEVLIRPHGATFWDARPLMRS